MVAPSRLLGALGALPPPLLVELGLKDQVLLVKLQSDLKVITQGTTAQASDYMVA